jgi:hypothetical protein
MTWHSLPDCSAEECASSLEPHAAIARYRSEWATDMRIEPGTPSRIGKGASDTWIHFTKETITVVGCQDLGNIYHENIQLDNAHLALPHRHHSLRCPSLLSLSILRLLTKQHKHLEQYKNLDWTLRYVKFVNDVNNGFAAKAAQTLLVSV